MNSNDINRCNELLEAQHRVEDAILQATGVDRLIAAGAVEYTPMDMVDCIVDGCDEGDDCIGGRHDSIVPGFVDILPGHENTADWPHIAEMIAPIALFTPGDGYLYAESLGWNWTA
jgi:hypothetical protein